MTQASLEEFKKIELKAAKIIEAEEIPGADRLWKLKVDVGAETKQIVAGIKAFYTRESLVGKTVIVVNNLAPVTLRGTESAGMLLAAKHESKLVLLTTDQEIAPGSIVG